jgi:hypothetical protein
MPDVTDHDLLTIVATKLDSLKNDLCGLKAEVTKRNDAFEIRLRSLEKTAIQTITWGVAIMIGLSLVEFLLTHFILK